MLTIIWGGTVLKKKVLLERLGILVLAAVLLVMASGAVMAQEYTTRDLNEQLVMGTLWYQRSAEMRALSYQAFNMARMVFDRDLEKGPSSKTRAVVVDIDETVLDNSPYEAGLVDMDFGYPKGWDEWIYKAQAKGLPGAVEFLRYVREKGGDVYYISNRKAKFHDATLKNLKQLGFPQADDEHLLLRTKTSDKAPRRNMVTKDHNIVLLMGDNLNDFDNIFRNKGLDVRMAAVDLMKEHFGTRFIVLPNPMYGDWEGAVYDYNWGLKDAEKSETRKKALLKWNLP